MAFDVLPSRTRWHRLQGRLAQGVRRLNFLRESRKEGQSPRRAYRQQTRTYSRACFQLRERVALYQGFTRRFVPSWDECISATCSSADPPNAATDYFARQLMNAHAYEIQYLSSHPVLRLLPGQAGASNVEQLMFEHDRRNITKPRPNHISRRRVQS
jgi:hypothetical protein